MSVPKRRPLAVALAVALTLGLGACSAGRPSASPTWVPQPDLQRPIDPRPELPQNGLIPEPQPSLPGPESSAPGNSSGAPQSPGASASPSAADDPAVVAKKLTKPTALVVMPDGTALVGERTTGRILRVQPTPGVAPRLEQTLTGLDATGDGGLLDLAVSPTFNQDGLLYAYITTATDNRVVHFALGTTPTPVLTGIPKGATGNTGRIAFDSAGALLTGTGDAGRPALVSDPASLAGKILRTDDLGKPWPGNPTPGSPVFASGLRSISGLCVNALTGTRFAISTTPEDAVNVIKPGKDYGTAAATGTLPAKSGAGGCTVSRGRLVVAARNDMALEITGLDEKDSFKTFSQTIQKRYGRLLTVVGASDGALWITTSNRDGKGKPGPDDDRVIRIVDIDAGGGSVV